MEEWASPALLSILFLDHTERKKPHEKRFRVVKSEEHKNKNAGGGSNRKDFREQQTFWV